MRPPRTTRHASAMPARRLRRLILTIGPFASQIWLLVLPSPFHLPFQNPPLPSLPYPPPLPLTVVYGPVASFMRPFSPPVDHVDARGFAIHRHPASSLLGFSPSLVAGMEQLCRLPVGAQGDGPTGTGPPLKSDSHRPLPPRQFAAFSAHSCGTRICANAIRVRLTDGPGPSRLTEGEGGAEDRGF